MTQYKQYEIRREILNLKGDDYTRSLLILLEHLDWSTGEKEILGNEHMKNWLLSLSSKYNVDVDCMHTALGEGVKRGWFRKTARGDKRFLSLGLKPVPSLIEEVPAPVETVEVPYHKREGWVALTRHRIRELVPCPKCGADAGLMCKGEKKGKNNREANHKERSQAASREAKRQFDIGNT